MSYKKWFYWSIIICCLNPNFGLAGTKVNCLEFAGKVLERDLSKSSKAEYALRFAVSKYKEENINLLLAAAINTSYKFYTKKTVMIWENNANLEIIPDILEFDYIIKYENYTEYYFKGRQVYRVTNSEILATLYQFWFNDLLCYQGNEFPEDYSEINYRDLTTGLSKNILKGIF